MNGWREKLIMVQVGMGYTVTIFCTQKKKEHKQNKTKHTITFTIVRRLAGTAQLYHQRNLNRFADQKENLPSAQSR